MAALVTMAGCTAADDRGALLSGGTVRIVPSSEPGYDYRFSIINSKSLMYNLEKPADRAQAVADFLADKCRSTQIVRETSLQHGTYAFNRPKKLYTTDVKCFR